MAMNYTTLTGGKDTEGSIKYFVRHDKVPSEYILERAQDAIYGILRVREMVTKVDGTLALDATTITLPTDFLEPISLWLRGDWKTQIRLLDHDHYQSRLGEQDDLTLYEGMPSEATFDGTTLYLNMKADQAYSYRLWYMKKPAVLSGSNETNFLTTRYSHLLEAMLKHYAWEHRTDDQMAGRALEKAMGYITKANEEYDMFKQQIRMEAYWEQ